MNRTGSETFGTKHIKTDDYIMAAKVIVSNGGTAQQAALELEAWDDILGLLSIRSIVLGQSFTKTGRLRKDRTTQALIEGRINLLVDDLKALEKIN